MNERAQPGHVPAAQGVAPFALERLDYTAPMVRHSYSPRRFL
jgi:hypothetical protein